MKTGKKLIPILCCIGIAHFCSAQQVEWKYTTNSDRWQNEHNVTVSKAQNQVKYDVLITSYKEQTIDGFGGCFNELGWDALNLLDSQKKQEVLNSLFHPKLV